MKRVILILLPAFLLITETVQAAEIPFDSGEYLDDYGPYHWEYSADISNGDGVETITSYLRTHTGFLPLGYLEYYQNNIDLVHVHEEARGHGVGSALMIRALYMIKSEGYKNAWWVASSVGYDQSCIPFYLKLGAKCVRLPKRSAQNRNWHQAAMEFDFERDGDPEHNLKRFNAPTFYRLK